MRDGNMISLGEDKVARIWSPETCREVRKLDWLKDSACLAISPDNRLALSGSTSLHLIDLETGARTGSVPGHHMIVQSAVFTPDGTRAVSGSIDHAIKVWDLAAARSESDSRQESPERIRLCPDGKTAVVVFWKRIELWTVNPPSHISAIEVAEAQHSAQFVLTPDRSRWSRRG